METVMYIGLGIVGLIVFAVLFVFLVGVWVSVAEDFVNRRLKRQLRRDFKSVFQEDNFPEILTSKDESPRYTFVFPNESAAKSAELRGCRKKAVAVARMLHAGLPEFDADAAIDFRIAHVPQAEDSDPAKQFGSTDEQRFGKRMFLLCLAVTVGGLALAGFTKYEETLLCSYLYYGGMLAFMLGALFMNFCLNDFFVSKMYQNPTLRTELALTLALGVGEILYFLVGHKDEGNTPLRSVRGLVLFGTFLGLFFFLLYRVIRKIDQA